MYSYLHIYFIFLILGHLLSGQSVKVIKIHIKGNNKFESLNTRTKQRLLQMYLFHRNIQIHFSGHENNCLITHNFLL